MARAAQTQRLALPAVRGDGTRRFARELVAAVGVAVALVELPREMHEALLVRQSKGVRRSSLGGGGGGIQARPGVVAELAQASVEPPTSAPEVPSVQWIAMPEERPPETLDQRLRDFELAGDRRELELLAHGDGEARILGERRVRGTEELQGFISTPQPPERQQDGGGHLPEAVTRPSATT